MIINPTINDLYQEENISKTGEYVSPSKKYKLVVNTYNTQKVTGKQTWEYTQGFVYDNNNNLIGTIKRNYSEFPFVFFKKDDIEYLVSGKSYMRQTILNCVTGQIYDNTDDPDGDDFCWASISQLDENTIVANGCYWGGGYEYKFFDFSNISKGWPELEVDEIVLKKGYIETYAYIDHLIDRKNGIITIIHSDDYESIDEETENDIDNNIDLVIHHDIILKLKRENDMIKMVSLELSNEQKQKEHDKDIKDAKENMEIDELRKNNPFYQHLIPKINELRDNNSFYQHLIPKINDLKLQVFDQVYLYKKVFKINISYKKLKTCIIEFSNCSHIDFIFYDWKNNSNNSKLQFEQNVNNINEIISKVKELLM